MHWNIIKARRVLFSNATSVLLHSLEPVRVSFIVASFIVHNSLRVEGRGARGWNEHIEEIGGHVTVCSINDHPFVFDISFQQDKI